MIDPCKRVLSRVGLRMSIKCINDIIILLCNETFL